MGTFMYFQMRLVTCMSRIKQVSRRAWITVALSKFNTHNLAPCLHNELVGGQAVLAKSHRRQEELVQTYMELTDMLNHLKSE